MDVSGQQFAERMGFDWASLAQDERLALAQLQQSSRNGFMSMISSGIGAIGTAVGGYLGRTVPSDVAIKEDIFPITHEGVLKKIASLPISTWRYKGDKVKHVGPMAQDFKKAFGLGDSDKHIHIVDALGVNLSGLKALAKKVSALEKRGK